MNRILKVGSLALLLVFAQAARITAQESDKESKPGEAKSSAKGADVKPGAESEAPKEESFVTEHTIRISGQSINYKATASFTLLKDNKGEPTAKMFSMAYTRNDVKDFSQRPIAFVYNGGPGSSSIWLHMGAFGPRRVVTGDATPTPPAPYKLEDNSNSLLDKADLVFIDPVGTGFSQAVGKAQNKDFWGVDEDVQSIAQFINTYINRNNRWNSPKFLIGESYGTFRSAALGNYLQSHDAIDINGIVLISCVLDMGGSADMEYIEYLPSYAAAAWFHKAVKNPPADLSEFVNEARKFASTEYAAYLMKGSNVTDAEKQDMAKKLSNFTGLSEDYLIKASIRVNLAQFNAELERSQGLTTGRYDSRFTMLTQDMLTETSENDPSYVAVNRAFMGAFNIYVREELKVNQERRYEELNFGVGPFWDWKHNGSRFTPNVTGDLAQALIENPHLHVQVENGYYDMATPFFATEYTMDHLLLPGHLRDNIELKYYNAGHMMYLHSEDLAKLKDNVGNFIERMAKQ
jgi:carboxypeptidase C (cathepsin A)